MKQAGITKKKVLVSNVAERYEEREKEFEDRVVEIDDQIHQILS